MAEESQLGRTSMGVPRRSPAVSPAASPVSSPAMNRFQTTTLGVDVRNVNVKLQQEKKERLDFEKNEFFKNKYFFKELERQQALGEGYLLKKEFVGLIKGYVKCWFTIFNQGEWLVYFSVKKGKNNRDVFSREELGLIRTTHIIKSEPPLSIVSDLHVSLQQYQDRHLKRLGMELKLHTPEISFEIKAENENVLWGWMKGIHIIKEHLKMNVNKRTTVLPHHPLTFEDVEPLQGELTVKEGLIFFNKRWVILRDGMIYVFDKRGGNCICFYSLYEARMEDYHTPREDKLSLNLTAYIPKNSQIVLRTDNEEDFFSWYNAILKHKLFLEVVLHSKLPTTEEES